MSTKTNGVRLNCLADGIPDGFELATDMEDAFPEDNSGKRLAGPVSETRTAYAIRCWTHGQVFLTYAEYMGQMSRPDSRWECPHCREMASFDDQNYDEVMDQEYEAYLDKESKGNQQ